MVIILVILFVR